MIELAYHKYLLPTRLACSLLKYYGAHYNHPTLSCFDELLAENYKNVVVMLFDGMGVDALEHHLKKDSFLRSHLQKAISSTFPPTTTAATTSIESGLTPAEHGWMGWSLYFSEINKIVDIFPNMVMDSEEMAAEYHVARKFIPYKSIFERINEAGNAIAYSVSPFGSFPVSSLDEIFTEVKSLCDREGRKYIYTYWNQPDSLMHEYGCYSDAVAACIEDINERIEALCGELSDTLVVVTADHGHTNIENMFLSDYPVLLQMLERPIAIESRAVCFYVKKECREQFEAEFKRAFAEEFLLLTKKQVIDQQLFGDGKPHLKFEEFIGDFLAIAIGSKAIVYSRESNHYMSHHAGMTEHEMLVPWISVVQK